MHTRSQYFRIYGFFAVLTLLVLTAGVWIGSARAQESASSAPPQTVALGGFLWSDTFGWISLNCVNDWNNNGIVALPAEDHCRETQGRYGVTVTFSGVTGELQGFAWSPHLGMVCFGRSCDSGNPPGGRTKQVTFTLTETVPVETPTGTIDMIPVHGFARVESQRGSNGWIDLEGIDGGAATTRTREVGGLALQRIPVPDSNPPRTRLVLTGSAWQRNANGTGAGWIYFGVSPPGNTPSSTQGNAQTAQETHTYPARTENCDVSSPQDEDADDGRNGDDSNGLTGANCQDYDCVDSAGALSFYDSASRRCIYRVDMGVDNRNERLSDDRNCFDGIDNDLNACAWNAVAGVSGRYVLKGTTIDCPLTVLPGSAVTPGIDCGDPACGRAINPATGMPCVRTEFSQNDEYNFCHDGVDNDGDGKVDCKDDDCAGFITCSASNLLNEVHPKCKAGGEFGPGACLNWCPGVNHTTIPMRTCGAGSGDEDCDGVCDAVDNCGKPGTTRAPNPDQADINANGVGDACDAWLQTKQGTIYAKRISGVPPPSEAARTSRAYTSTFCILTSGAPVPAGFTTDPSTPCSLPNLSTLTAPQLVSEFKLRQYNDSLALLTDTLRARLNIRGLKEGRYGAVEQITGTSIDVNEIADPRTVAVYYYDARTHNNSALTLMNTSVPPLPFQNGSRTRPGARVVLVEGADLIIGNDLSYASARSADVHNLASIAFVVVGGNIRVERGVRNLVGSFVTTGTMSTGTNASEADVPLDIAGLLVARQFRFERNFRSQERGAEVITYDGRAVLNPPPGLADFIKTLPSFRSVTPR